MNDFTRRVLIVEDDVFLASLMSSALSAEGMDTVAASSAAEAKREVRRFDPDVVIADIDLGDGPNGIDLVKVLQVTHPHIVLILLTRHPDSTSAGYSPEELPDGVAYLRKSLINDTAALLLAIDDAAKGFGNLHRQDRASTHILSQLTKTQRDILHQMALGLTNQEIATRRGVSLSSVEQRITVIFKLLGIEAGGSRVPRVEAIRQYIRVAGLPER
jgi:DNA-binding NarL/FixJ family response regulator